MEIANNTFATFQSSNQIFKLSMKRIVFLRHAKSTHSEIGLADFNRPLNGRGIEEAMAAGNWLKQNKIKPQTLYSSLAIRCVHTSTIVMQILKINYDSLYAMSDLYETDQSNITKTIQQTESKTTTILLCNHNPLLDDIVKKVLNDDNVQFTTGSVAVFNYNAPSWSNFDIKECSPDKIMINQRKRTW
jgi:phosphohistidine phosphatase